MLDERSWWLFQAAIAFASALVFLLTLVDLARGKRPSLETLTVLLAGLVVIAFANVATSYGTAVDSEDLRNTGGTTVRAVLVVLAIYLLAWRRRPR